MSTAKYEIGGFGVEMTTDQASRWNAGETTEGDLSAIQVAIPQPTNDARYITLRRALEEFAGEMESTPANRTGE